MLLIKEMDVTTYTVARLAEMAGITVRTLHHYDELGLLRPTARTAAGYRLYGEHDLLRLQQILFFRELDFPLEQIKTIVDDPGFDQVHALQKHREMLQLERERLSRLLSTIDKTIASLTEENMGITDEELWEGFSQEQIERYRRESREAYGAEVVEESERRARGMSKAQWQSVKDEGDAVTRGLAALADRPVDDPDVQALIARHYKWVSTFWTPNAEAYQGLGQLYTENPEFRANYDKYRTGLADFMREAMTYYAEHELVGK
jgi:DNA-binding transcriptional MerR regulator